MKIQQNGHELRNRQLLAMLFAILVSILYLRMSQLGGRLAGDLTFDDLSYAHDAARRLLIATQYGLLAFVNSFAAIPPHSPFSTVLALSAFAIGGLSEFAMYASNTLILVAIAAFVTYELRHARRPILLLALSIVLFSPIAFRTIHDFRPDVVLGFATAVMAWWFIGAIAEGESRLFRRAGFAFGVCLLIKPTFFAHTLAIAAFLVILAITAKIFWYPKKSLTTTINKRDLAWFIGLGIAVSGPYFIVGGSQIFHYFWDNTRGKNAAIWSFTESTPFLQLLKTYLWDHEFAFLLLGYHLILSIVALLLCGLLLLMRGAKIDVIKIAAMCATACASLCIIVIGRHKNEFFLASFQWMLLLSAIYAVAALDQRLKEGAKLSLLVGGIAGLLITICANGTLTSWRHPLESLRGDSWNRKIFELIQQHQNAYADMGAAMPIVFFPFSGQVNPRVLDWIGMQQGVRLDTFGDPLSTDVELAKSSAERADYVVLPNDLLAGYDRWMPSTSIQVTLLEWVLNNPQFKLLSPLAPNLHYLVFANAQVFEGRTGVLQVDGIPLSIDGFFNEEGPYPQWSLPRLRWMSQNAAKLCVFNRPIINTHVNLRFRADSAGSLEVSDGGGAALATVELTPGKFMDLSFSYIPKTTTNCLNFSARIDVPTDPTRLLLFTKIELGGE